MKFEELELENVCQHKKLKHVWQPGLNGIVGPNGSGKSNIIKAMKFAITGEFDNAGTKAENIYQLARDKARSQVVLKFEHDGVKAKITRVLRGGTTSCQIGGAHPIDGDMAVTAAIMEFLGVDKRILSEYIFVPQRRMAGFVDETPGERNKTFGQLFNLAAAEFIYKMLDAEIKRTNPAMPSQEIEPLRLRVDDGQKLHAELTQEIATIEAKLQKLNPAAAKTLIDAADKAAGEQAIVNALDQQVNQMSADLEISQKELAETDKERAELVQAREEAATDIDAARDALARWETNRLRKQREEVLLKRQKELDVEPAMHQEPKLPTDGGGREKVTQWLEELNHEVSVRKDLLNKCGDLPTVCPTCGTETDSIQKKVKTYRDELPELEANRVKAQQLLNAYGAYDLGHARWQQWASDYAKRKAELAGDWKAFKEGATDIPTADPDTCRSVVEAGEGLEKAILETAARVDQMRKTVNQQSGRLDQESMRLIGLRKKMSAVPDPAAVAKAKKALEEAAPLNTAISRAQGELKAINAGLAQNGAMLQRLEEAELKAETDRLWAYHLGEVRKVMHHDALPKIVAQNYLEILADDTNELLESFDADFRIGMGVGLNFEATFLRGPYAGAVSPAQRLSEGQKVILALAFRVAVNSLFAGTAGLLCLDEPTESLDERNLACLEVAIGKMRDLSESRGIQCLLVTHEPSFEVLFDGVLRLVA
jgi:exonuclease SbcC